MFEQISMFEMIEPVSRFTAEMKLGSGFSGGKYRIFAASLQMSKDQLAIFLKDEYGIGGHSADFPDGNRGFTDYNAKGITIRDWSNNQVEKHSWKEAAAEIKRLIMKGEYLTEKEKARLKEASEYNGGVLPMPVARMAFAAISGGST